MDHITFTVEAANGYRCLISIPMEYVAQMDYVTRMTMECNQLPVVSIPFALHSGGSIHTVCRRLDDAMPDVIDRIEL
jgi:hypothetical protein